MSTDGGPAELDAERAARVLAKRGSLRESIALLRGAVARDREEEGCARMLEQVLSGAIPTEIEDDLPLDLAVVDRWIRRGMLVEALALLGGTPLGGDELGREWANLLGELLAPVPSDAEETLVQMHRHLLTGGASVALVLLQERSGKDPALPAWASRRLELLRWMLLDNAGTAQSHPAIAGEAPTALAAALQDAINRRSLTGALEVARSSAAADPHDPDPPALVRAIEAIFAELERHAVGPGGLNRTLPMLGHPAACMQLRMGNLGEACIVYRKILRHADDADAQRMLGAVEAVLRATRGEPVVDADVWWGETEHSGAFDTVDLEVTATTVNARARDTHTDRSTIAEEEPEGSGATAHGPPERSPPGSLPVLLLTPELACLEVEDESTMRTPPGPELAERLLADGHLDDAERVYRMLAAAHPHEPKWVERAEHVRRLRRAEKSLVVLVRQIRKVE